MENSAYMPTSLASPALMVLASSAERDSLHMQNAQAFPGQAMDSKDMHLPFTASSFSMRSVYGQPDTFPSLPAHLLHLHSPFLTPGMERSLGFINPTGGSGAFRPVAAASATVTSSASEDRNGFHSAFMPTTTKSSKMESVSSFAHSLGADVGFTNSLAGRMSPIGVKEESSDKDTSSSLDLQERLTETPGSDITDTTERSTPDEGRSLRRPKKRSAFDSQTCSCCPICGVTLRSGEIESHFQQEVHKLSRIIKRPIKDSSNSKNAGNSSSSSSSSSKKKQESLSSPAEKNTPESRWESYNRVKANRQGRLSVKSKSKKRKQVDETTCPVCNERLTGTAEELNAHAEQCLQKRETEEDEQVDVEGETFDEYEWAGQTRIRATSLLQGGFVASGFQTSNCRSSDEPDIDLNVDGDDTEMYGQPQYQESDVIPCQMDQAQDDDERQALRGAVISNEGTCTKMECNPWSSEDDSEFPSHTLPSQGKKDDADDRLQSCPGTLDTTLLIESLKNQVKDIEAQYSEKAKTKCLICMGSYNIPLVSVSCWHVHCEQCWLRTLGAKKLCPQCNMITTPQDLRRIYL